ncbi:hypothetical protein [Pseudonocardia parietis]|uniref:Uncharacterized protein n=1 Tax=Pseudonocardia parietis TaxID=570936 RepID=A0ABS4W0A4_9PSEU|nr:hypothetical protein [Pseudonocardia parietis]MBP2369635.1 hypothetical protein [Pseudonocardia parietis]
MLRTYRRQGRILDAGTREEAEASGARAWLADTLAGCRMPDAGCRMPDAGCRTPDAGRCCSSTPTSAHGSPAPRPALGDRGILAIGRNAAPPSALAAATAAVERADSVRTAAEMLAGAAQLAATERPRRGWTSPRSTAR